jgi:signal transduction histidine kinase
MPLKIIKAARRRLQRSIQTKLAIVLVLVGFISLSLLGFISVWLGKQEVENEVGKRNREVATLISSQVESYIKNVTSNLEFAGRSLYEATNNTNQQNYDPGFLISLLIQTSSQPYQNLAWVDKNGIQRAVIGSGTRVPPGESSLLDKLPVDMTNDPIYQANKAGKTYFSTISFIPGSNDPIMLIAVPVLDRQNEFQGSLIAQANLKNLNSIVTNVKTDQTTEAILVNEAGVIVASTEPQEISSKVTNPRLLEALKGQPNINDFTNEQGELYLMGYASVNGQPGWGLIVCRSAHEALAGISRMALIALIVVIGAIIAISLIALLLSKTITRPIRELAFTANQITTTGNLDAQIPITSQDEVGELSASFNGMILALRKTRLALEHWNRELEHKVELRTQELTRSNEKLEQINEQLERANLHKSQFLANMSHELRTPLNAIIGFSEILQDQVFGELNEKQLRYINNILNSGRHLLSLVNDVLDLAKVEAGRMELSLEEFSYRQISNEVINQLSALATKKELSISSEIEDKLDVIVADRSRFRQILYNLLSNAIKFTPQGGSIKISGKRETDTPPMIVFTVSDTGIGIASEYLEDIFDSFRQLDNSYSRQYQGTGLGLALTRKLVEMHGGKIWVTSEPGMGSTFSFTIPVTTVPVFKDTTPQEVPLLGG